MTDSDADAPVVTRPDAAGRPDTSDMLAVHAVFRNALRSSPTLVLDAGEDPERVYVVAEYYAEILELVRVHHQTEDDLLWDRLERRYPEQRPRIEEIAVQHHALDALLPDTKSALDDWRANPREETAEALVGVLTAMDDALIPHFDIEEAVILPMAADEFTVEEWAQLGQQGLRRFRGKRPWLVLGLIRENMTQEQRDAMVAHMPPDVVASWQDGGEARFADFVGRLRA